MKDNIPVTVLTSKLYDKSFRKSSCRAILR